MSGFAFPAVAVAQGMPLPSLTPLITKGFWRLLFTTVAIEV